MWSCFHILLELTSLTGKCRDRQVQGGFRDCFNLGGFYPHQPFCPRPFSAGETEAHCKEVTLPRTYSKIIVNAELPHAPCSRG